MPVKNKIGGEHFLKNVPLPQETKSYKVISHEDIIDKVKQTLNDNNFYIDRKNYQYSFGGEVVLATLYIKSNKDSDIGMTFNWCNSYNKKLRFGCYIGGFIFDNDATFTGLSGINWLRKHTGTALEESMTVIDQVISYADEFFDNLIQEKEDMLNTQISMDEYSNILGNIYFAHNLLTSSQTSVITKDKIDLEKQSPLVEPYNTLWDLYKVVMSSLQGCDITKTQLQQQQIHEMIMMHCSQRSTLNTIDITVEKTAPVVTTPTVDPYAEYCVDNSEYDIDLVNFYMLSNSTKGLTEEEFCNNFISWASGTNNSTQTDVDEDTENEITNTDQDDDVIDDTPEITGIPNGDTMSDTDDKDDEDWMNMPEDNDSDNIEQTKNHQVDLEESITEVESENTKTESNNTVVDNESTEVTTVDDDFEDLLDLF